MKVYLFDLASQTFVHSPRHLKTARFMSQYSAGLEYRIVLDDSLAPFTHPHINIKSEIVECPEHLLDLNRFREIKEESELKDDVIDMEVELAKFAEAGLCLEDFPNIKEGKVL